MSKWISVEDRLPENDEYVLVCCRASSQVIRVSWYSTHQRKWATDFSIGFGEVTHWQPLPLPPGAEE
jgi:hypothetical protein